MQRVRIGLTGLAFVFLAVLLAAVFTSQSAEEEPITANLIEQSRSGTAAAPNGAKQAEPAPPRDPLSEIGVAPGGGIDNGAAAKNGPAVEER
jgi:hypothetical protein